MSVSSVGLTQLAAAAQSATTTAAAVKNNKQAPEQDKTPVKAAVPSTVGKAIDISA